MVRYGHVDPSPRILPVALESHSIPDVGCQLCDSEQQQSADKHDRARLPMGAVLEDLDTRTPRGIDPRHLAQVRDLAWISEHLTVLITGPCGVGKRFIACALAHAACRTDHSVRCLNRPGFSGGSNL